MFDGKAFGLEIVEVTKAFVQRALAPVLARLEAAEKLLAMVAERPPGPVDIDAIVAAAVAKALADQPKINPAVVDKLATDLVEVQELVTGLPGPDGLVALVEKTVAAKVAELPVPRDGKDVEPDAVRAMVAEAVGALPKPADGKSVTLEEVRPLVDEIVAAKVAEFPPPLDGKDVDPEAVRAMVAEAVDALPKPPTVEEVAALVPPAVAGKDADPEVIAGMVKDSVAAVLTPLQAAVDAAITDVRAVNDAATAEMKAAYEQSIADLPKVPTAAEVAALVPAPQDGKSVTIGEVRPLVDDAVLAAVSALPEAKVEPEAIAAEVDKVLATWERPKDGKSVTAEEVMPALQDALAKVVAALPPAKDGVGLAGMLIDRDGELVATLTDGTTKKLGPVVGKDGANGMGPSDFEMVDDGDGVIYRMSAGDKVKEWRIPKPTMADFFQYGWKDGTEYKRGALVMYGGQPWLAMADTKARPDGNSDWAMFAKKPRDGKDGVMLEPKPKPTVKLG